MTVRPMGNGTGQGGRVSVTHTVAPLWRRGAAGALDSLAVLVVALPFMLRSRRKGARPGARPGPGSGLAAIVAAGVYEIPLVAGRGHTLGQMIVGIRVVDEGTGAVPTLKQAAVRWAVAVTPQGLTRLVPVSGGAERALSTVTDLQPEIERLRQAHRGDREQLNRALMRLYVEQGVNPARDFLSALLGVVPGIACSLAVHGPAFVGPRHRGLHDRLAGTLTVHVS